MYKELGLKDNEIENAERNADTTDFQLQGDKVLHDWRSMKGRDATKGAILEALKECKYKDEMGKLAEKWNISLNTWINIFCLNEMKMKLILIDRGDRSVVRRFCSPKIRFCDGPT